MDKNVGLRAADHIVVAASLLAPLGIGVLFAIRDRKKSTREEYLMGNRQMSLIPVTLSLFVTFQSSVSLLGFPGEHYIYGPMICLLFIGISLSYVVGYFLMIPLMYPLKLTSMYEYIYLRYESEAVRKTSTLMGMFQTIFYMSVVLLGPALALQATVSTPLWMSVIAVGVTGTVYTAIGGIKSVVWTDTFQTVLLFTGMFAVLIKGTMAVGGLTEAMDIARAGGRLSLDQFDPDPRHRHTWGAMVIGAVFIWLPNIFNQSSIQRVSAMKTLKAAKISFLTNIPICIVYATLLYFTGVVIYAFFDQHKCDPLKAGFISSRDQLVPFYVLHTTQDLPGMAGVFMATLFGGTLSTVSSGINALSANTVEDFLKNQLQSFKESTVTLITKMIAVIYGIIITSLAYAFSFMGGTVVQLGLSILGAFGSPVIGMFLFGSMIPWTNKYGALVGGVVSLSVNIFLSVMKRLYGRKPVSLPPASIANCYSNISSMVGKLGNSSVFSSNQVLLDKLNVNYDVDQYDLFSPTDAEPIFDTTTLSLTNTSTKNPHDFGFFLFDISYEWGSLIGLIIFAIVGLTVSWLTRGIIKNSPDPRLMIPCCRRGSAVTQIIKIDSVREDSKVPAHKYTVVPTNINEDFKRDVMELGKSVL